MLAGAYGQNGDRAAARATFDEVEALMQGRPAPWLDLEAFAAREQRAAKR